MSKLQRFDRSGCTAAAHHVAGNLDPTYLESTGGILVDEKWKDILASAITLHRHAGETRTRIVFNEISIFVETVTTDRGLEVFAVALPTGAGLTKSIGRMIKRAAGVKP